MKIPIIMHKSKSGRIYYYYGYEWRMCNMYKESENDTARLTLTSKNNTVLINVDNSNYYL